MKTHLRILAAAISIAVLSSCGAAAIAPAQQQSVKEGSRLKEKLTRQIDEVTDQSSQKYVDLCAGVTVQGFDCNDN